MRTKDHIVNEPFDDGRNYLSHADVIKIELFCDIRNTLCEISDHISDIREPLADIAGALTQLVAQGNSQPALARAHNLLMSAVINRITDTWLEDAREVLKKDSIKENSE